MEEEKSQSHFHTDLREIIDDYVHGVYDVTLRFPKEEMYGVISQLRRSALSIALNYIEGYARKKRNVLNNFLEIAYGSLKESRYLLYFSYKRKYMSEKELKDLESKGDRIGKMIWGILDKI